MPNSKRIVYIIDQRMRHRLNGSVRSTRGSLTPRSPLVPSLAAAAQGAAALGVGDSDPDAERHRERCLLALTC